MRFEILMFIESEVLNLRLEIKPLTHIYNYA